MNCQHRLTLLFTVILSLALSACGSGATTAPTPAAPTDSPTEVAPVGVDETIRFAIGPTSVTKDGSVVGGSRDRYNLDIISGEVMNVQIMSLEQNAVFVILGPDGAELRGAQSGQDATSWVGVLSNVGTYVIEVGPTRGNATYTLVVDVGDGAFQPLTQELCGPLKDEAQSGLGVEVTVSESAFYDPISQSGGLACTLEAHGTGANWANPQAVFDALASALITWAEKPEYAADGLTGSARGYINGAAGPGKSLDFLLLVSAVWEPSPDANCPADQPISACPLKPEQQLYTVTLKAAQREVK